MSERIETQVMKLGFKTKLGFAMAEAANSLIIITGVFYLLYFLTDVYGISAAAAGTLFLIARTWDAANDPLMGYIADHTRSRWGRFRPYLLLVALPYGLVNFLLYTTPNLGMSGKIVYMYIVYIAYGMLFTAISVPHNALLATLTRDTRERSNLAGFKIVVGMIATMVVAVAVKPVVAMFPDEQTGFQVVAGGIFSMAAVIFYWITFASTKEQVIPEEKERYPVRMVYRMIAQNPPLIWLCCSAFFAWMVQLALVASAIYYFKYVVLNEGLYPLFMLILMVCVVLSSAVTPAIANRIGKAKTYKYANVVAILGCLLMYLTAGSSALTLGLASVVGIGVAPPFVLTWSMTADTVEYAEWKTGIRSDGLNYSLIGFVGKLAAAVAGAASGFILSMTGYVPNVQQSPFALKGIVMNMTLLPLAFSIISLALITFYRLDYALYSRIIDDLNKRKLN